MTIQGITWVRCGGFRDKRTSSGGRIVGNEIEVMRISGSSVIIQKNTFQHSIGPAIRVSCSNFIINQCSFMLNNDYTGHGAAIYLDDCTVHGTHIINNCNLVLIKV